MEEELNFLLIMLHQTNLLIEAFFPDSNFRVAEIIQERNLFREMTLEN
jgi:hypothetical protein